jgi:PAS domain S-box-containing protein
LSEERALRAKQELRDFLENAVEGIHSVDSEGRILWTNQAELDLLGYSRDECVGRYIQEFHSDAKVAEAMLRRLRQHETLRDHEALMRCKRDDPDGVDSNAKWEKGEFIHTRCFTRDITERKRAETAQSFLSAIVESAADAIVSKTLDGDHELESRRRTTLRVFG